MPLGTPFLSIPDRALLPPPVRPAGRCPVCGGAGTLYARRSGRVLGCACCVRELDAEPEGGAEEAKEADETEEAEEADKAGETNRADGAAGADETDGAAGENPAAVKEPAAKEPAAVKNPAAEKNPAARRPGWLLPPKTRVPAACPVCGARCAGAEAYRPPGAENRSDAPAAEYLYADPAGRVLGCSVCCAPCPAG